MEPFIVSARKYRPKTFADVVGQEAITNTLTNAIEHDHLAQALLFCGPRGVGKTTCARILAKNINQDGTERQDEDFAFNIFELDAASNNSVDDIRNLIDQVRIPPQTGKYKVYIIDEVHMLSQSAFNAFLKTLEEPPRHAIFILATTEKHKIIPTILSRCQIFDFKRITVKDAATYLKYIAEQQGIEAEEDALHIIAQKADGAMRDALSIFDRVVSFSGKQLTRKAVTENLNVLDYDTFFEATDLALAHDIPQLLLLLNRTLALGFDAHHFINGLASHFRDLMVCRHQETVTLLEVGEGARKKYLEQSGKTSQSFLLRALEIANTCDLNYKTSKNQRLLVELTLMKLASLDFGGEKKKHNGSVVTDSISLIPASYFLPDEEAHRPKTDHPTEEIAAEETVPEAGVPQRYDPESPKEEANQETVVAAIKMPSKVDTALSEESDAENKGALKKVHRNIAAKRVSALSLSGLKAQKEHRQIKRKASDKRENLPKEPFTESDMQRLWAEFAMELDKEGRKLLASLLTTDTPKLLKETVIWISLPNDTMKKELEREQHELLGFLRSRLENYDIDLKINVDEEVAKKYAFTPAEKYEKLREKNPAIDLLRKEFDLDL